MTPDDDELVRRIHAESLARRQGYPKCERCVLASRHSEPHDFHGLPCPKCGCASSWTDERGLTA